MTNKIHECFNCDVLYTEQSSVANHTPTEYARVYCSLDCYNESEGILKVNAANEQQRLKEELLVSQRGIETKTVGGFTLKFKREP